MSRWHSKQYWHLYVLASKTCFRNEAPMLWPPPLAESCSSGHHLHHFVAIPLNVHLIALSWWLFCTPVSRHREGQASWRSLLRRQPVFQSWLLVFVLQPAIWQPAVYAMLQGNCCTENTCAINKRFTCDSAAASSCWVRSIENSLLLHVHTQWMAHLSFCQEAAKT